MSGLLRFAEGIDGARLIVYQGEILSRIIDCSPACLVNSM